MKRPMNTLYYILNYCIHQALLHGVCNSMNAENKAARERNPDAALVVSLHHVEHPMAQLWRAINKEQMKLE